MLSVICCMALGSAAAAPNVAYTASGTFATPQISGLDTYCLRGEQFSIMITANEALRPTSHDHTTAQYTNLPLQGVVYSCFDSEPGTLFHLSNNNAKLRLQVGAGGAPDEVEIEFSFRLYDEQLTISAQATAPAGTITARAISPFSAPVALNVSSATLTYSDQYNASTTLGVANGTLNAAVEKAPSGYNVLYNFSGADGKTPDALALGSEGALYGTTLTGGSYGHGTVFSLTPTASGGPWTEDVLYSFGVPGDGVEVQGGLVISSNGVLYGVAAGGGTYYGGAAFALSPPSTPGGAWTETILHEFGQPNDGTGPMGLVMGSNGVLYGTTIGGGVNAGFGTVFSLTPPSTPGVAWTEQVLYSFSGSAGDGVGPSAGPVLSAGGVLYGVTGAGGNSNKGTVFQLSPGQP